MKSALLRQLADAAGGGSYFGFIPDGTMNATVFNCALANLHVTCAADTRLTLRLRAATAAESAPAFQLVGGYGAEAAAADADGTLRITAAPGALQFGAPRSFLLQGIPPGGWDRLAAELSYRQPGLPCSARCTATLPAGCAVPLDAAAVAAARHRLSGAEAITRAARLARMDADAARAIIRAAAAPMLAEPHGREPPVLGDLLGEVSGALATPEAFNRWGEHFLRFCPAASLLQSRLNFKDPGGLAFGGAPFLAQLAALDAAFVTVGVPMPSLAPPALGVPAGARGQAFSATSSIPTFTATVFADSFNNQRGGCFALSCAVALPGGGATTVGALRAGDAVATGLGPDAGSARIRCVVEYTTPVRVVTLPGGGPTLTPWHPVKLPGASAWAFPARIVDGTAAATAMAPRVRTFVLESGSAGCVVIDGVLAATLGHGRTDDAVLAHAFYGTRRVIDDLSAFPGWQEGLVRMCQADELWDDAAGALLGYRPAASATAAGSSVLAAAASVRAC